MVQFMELRTWREYHTPALSQVYNFLYHGAITSDLNFWLTVLRLKKTNEGYFKDTCEDVSFLE